MTRAGLVCFCAMSLVATAWADVVALYNFDRRAPRGKRIQPLRSARMPYSGEDYVPKREAGERGPTLANPGPGGRPEFYRSWFNHSATDASEGRQTLELNRRHVFHLDTWRTKDGEGPLPARGSFTWELVVRIDAYSGVNHFGMLLDSSRGAGRVPNYPGRAVTCRLWMGKRKDDGTFPLCFSVPVNARNRVVTVATRIEFGKWYHLAAVYDEPAGKARLYVDGRLRAEAEVHSRAERSTGFCLAGFGPDVFRIDHIFRLERGLIDAVAFRDDVAKPGGFSLYKGTRADGEE